MPEVAVLVPMLGRPHRVAPLLESIHHTSPEARVLFLVSPGDDLVFAEIDRLGQERITVERQPYGDYARKINRGYEATDEPLLFTAADDLLFHEGWLKRATGLVEPGIGVIGTNDLGSPRVINGEHSTHSLIVRDYVDRHGTIDEPGKILHEGYPHEWVDDELVGTAKHRNAFAFAVDSHVEHLHPCWGKAPTDPLYAQQSNRMRRGRAIYQQRRYLWS